MFKYVHHVHYVVKDCDAMMQYFEKNFGMKPVSVKNIKNGKEALYVVGETQIEVSQPYDSASKQGKFLAAHGSGVFHVAWGVDDIVKLSQDILGRAPHERLQGDLHFTMPNAESQGIMIQVAGRSPSTTGERG